MSALSRLVARGCLCAGDSPADCPLHGPGDNRGLAAFFKAGMPGAFPTEGVTCGVCRSDQCLMYPDPFTNSGDGHEHRPSTICPNCSTPANESFLRFRAEEQGFTPLKPICVFTTTTRLLIVRRGDQVREARLGDDPGSGWEPVTDPAEYRLALDALEQGCVPPPVSAAQLELDEGAA